MTKTRFFDDPVLLAPPDAVIEPLPAGGFILSSPEELRTHARCIGDWLELWATKTPGALFLAERDADGAWMKLSYAEARRRVGALAQALLDLRLEGEAPVVCLSDNSIEHALLMLATMHIGRPFCTVSSAYSRWATNHRKIAAVIDELAPSVIYASDGKAYGAAIRAVNADCPVVLGCDVDLVDGALAFNELLATTETPSVAAAFARVLPEMPAKYLLTSGSTGHPKVVVNTHAMLCANQQQILQSWRFLEIERPVVVSWLPWSHTFGSNHIFNMVLSNGGSLYLDEGRPAPGLVESTVRNLREIQPTLLFNVPRGFDVMLPLLESDPEAAAEVFGRVRTVFYAAAALPQSTWDRLTRVVRRVRGDSLWFTAAWGATEASPLVTNVHWRIEAPGCIGLPVAGTHIKFVPNAGKLEMRVRGPQVFPGYRNRPDLTAAAFDEDGYYRIGDAGYLCDPQRPDAGIQFDGRIAEDFKLTTGTWVSVGTLRLKAISAFSPYVQDVVIAGHDRDEVGLLLLLSAAGSELPEEVLRDHVRRGMREMQESGAGSSMSPRRALILTDAPSLEAGEITDKGYLNQRAVLACRAHQVEHLYGDGDIVVRPDWRF